MKLKGVALVAGISVVTAGICYSVALGQAQGNKGIVSSRTDVVVDPRKSAAPRMIQVEEEVWVNLNKDLLRMHDELVKAKTDAKVSQAEVDRLRKIAMTSPTAGTQPGQALKKSDAKSYQVHRVAKNENLWKIAVKYYNDGFKWRWIFKANLKQIEDPNYIYPEMILDIPKY